MKQRIMVTGPLGHIGSKWIHSVKPGDFEEVLLVDNLLTQRYPSLFNLPEGVKFTFMEIDICKADWDILLKGVDTVLHFAAITDAASSFGKAAEVEAVNFQATERLARACAKHKVRLLFPSTTSVYGTQDTVVDENCPREKLQPQSPYAQSKFQAEELLRSLGQSEGLRSVVCRFGTICGTSIGMRFHTAVNKFCWQSVMGQPLTVWRTALHQKRPYLTLDDAIASINFIIRKDLFDNALYNVVTDNLTVDQIINIIRKSVKDVRVEYVDTPIMNQLSYEVLSDRLCALGFTYKGSIEQDIQDTVTILGHARWNRG